jgi:AraC family transcriptional regulator
VSAHVKDARLVRLPTGSFYGQSIQNREVCGLLLVERAYPAGLQTPTHAHENDFFFLVLQGACRETAERKPCDMGPATLAFQPRGRVHADLWPGPGGRCFNVELTPRWRDHLHELPVKLESPQCFRGGLAPRLGMRIYQEFIHADAVSPLVIEALTLELVAELFRGERRQPASPPAWLRRIQELLRARFAEHITLAELGRSESVHPVSVATAFRKHFGCTVGEYLRQQRVEFACQRLAASTAPLAQISVETGFADQSHFNRTFKRLVGTTPAAYRNALRNRA